jgi:hypothetical protein
MASAFPDRSGGSILQGFAVFQHVPDARLALLRRDQTQESTNLKRVQILLCKGDPTRTIAPR